MPQPYPADQAIAHMQGLRAERVMRDAAQRPAFEAINNTRAERTRPACTVADLRDQITEAQRLLALADAALCEWFGRVDMDRARRLMDDAEDALAEG